MFLFHCRRELYVKSLLGNHVLNLMRPLHPSIWFCLFSTLALCTFAIKMTYSHDEGTEKVMLGSYLTCMLPVHSLVNQGVSDTPKKYSSRIVFIVTLLCGVIISASFSACMTSLFAVKDVHYPFTDLKSLLQKSNYEIIMLAGTAILGNYKVNEESLQHSTLTL